MHQYNHRMEEAGPQKTRGESTVRPCLAKTGCPQSFQMYHDDISTEPVGRTEQQQLPNAKELVWERNLTPQKRQQHNTWMLKWVKVKLCLRREKHPWRKCPYRHRSEKVTRRDPWEYGYSFEACPDFEPGKCREGDRCRRAHGFFEKWMHPQVFRMQKCCFGLDCQRDCCFFAHDVCQYQGDRDWNKLVPAPESSYVSEYQNQSQGISLESKREQQHSTSFAPTRKVQLYPENEDHGWPEPPPSALNSPRSTQSAFTSFGGSLASTVSSGDFPESPLTPPRFPPSKDPHSPPYSPSNRMFSHASHRHPTQPSPLQGNPQPYQPMQAEGAPASAYRDADLWPATWRATSGDDLPTIWESAGERNRRILETRHLDRQVAEYPRPPEQHATGMESFYLPFERSYRTASGTSEMPRQSLFGPTPATSHPDYGPVRRPHHQPWNATNAWESPFRSSYNEERSDVDQAFSSNQAPLPFARHTYIEEPNRVTDQNFY